MAEARKKKNETPVSTVSSQMGSMVSDLRYGRAIGLEFFRKNAWLIIVFVVAILSLMGLRFKTMSKMSEIKKLTTELEISKSQKLHYKSQYMSLIRESEIQKLVDSQNLNLQFQEQPPYQLSTDNK